MTTEQLKSLTDGQLRAIHAAKAGLRAAIERELIRRALERLEREDVGMRIYGMMERAHANPAHNPGMDVALALILATAIVAA